jgi:hypothetical protein
VTVEVKQDPRTEQSLADIRTKQKYRAEVDTLMKEARESYDKIIQARKSIALVEKILELQPDSISRSYKDRHKTLNTKLDSLSNLFMEPENVKGIQRNPDQLNALLFGARNNGDGGFYESHIPICMI